MARVIKAPTAHPPFGKTPLKHGAKVEVVNLSSRQVMKMDANGALRANVTSADSSSGNRFIVSQIGAAVMLQCPRSRLIIGANAGYLYGFNANQQQGALRVYYHEDSGAVEFESCADPGKFLAFDKSGNFIPLNGVSAPLQRQFAVRCIEKDAKQEAPKSSLDSFLSMGVKAVNNVVGEGKTQYNLEKNKMRGILLNGGRIRLRRKDSGRYVSIMANGIVHGNGDATDVLIVHHCFGVNRYSFQSAKFPQLWLSVTLDNITWAMVNNKLSTANTENPMMVWEIDRCQGDGTILLRRNTQISTGILHQYLGFAPTGKPTPTLIFPEEMGDIFVESASAPLHAAQTSSIPIPAPLHAAHNSAVPMPGPPQYAGAPPPHSGAPPPQYASAPPGAPHRPPPPGAGAPPPPSYSPPGAAPAEGGSSEGMHHVPPGALLYDGAVIVMTNRLGYLCIEGEQLSVAADVTKDCDFKVSSAGSMTFTFENVKNKVFLKATESAVTVGPSEPSLFQVRFNPNGSVTFEANNSNVYIGLKDPEIFLQMA